MHLIRFFKRELASDARNWVQDGLVNKDQAQAILSRYGTNIDYGKNSSGGYYILLSLASVLIAAAILIIVSRNWDQIPNVIRVGGLVGSTLACFAVGTFFHQEDREGPANIWLFLASALYGTSIFLIAQIYHLGEHFPDGIFYWALGVLPLIFITKSMLLSLFFTFLAILWFITDIGYGNVPIFFLIFMSAVLYFSIKFKHSTILFLVSTLGVLGYFEVLIARHIDRQWFFLDFGVEHVYFTVAAFLTLYLLSDILTKSSTSTSLRDYGTALQVWTVRFAIIFLLFFSCEWPWKSFLTAVPTNSLFIAISVVLALAALIYPLTRLVLGEGKDLQTTIFEQGSFVVYPIFFLIAATVAYGTTETNKDTLITLMQLGTNILLLGMGCWLIISGCSRGSSTHFFSGVGVILITALIRYINLIGGYIASSLGFLAAGVILFGAAQVWKHHMAKLEVTE